MCFKLSRNVALSILFRSASFACLGCLATLSVAGRELDTIYAVPPPGQAALSWRDRVCRCGPSVMLVGDLEHFTGTAFVISSKNRLLATNAHVADKFYELGSMVARANGTTKTYTVDRVWYHPGVVRKHDHSLEIRCQDPSHGEVVIGCPDVAVLHLADGPELPFEFTLATPEDLNELFAQHVAMLGYPASDRQPWLAAGENPQASFREGTVNQLTSLKACGSRDSREPQLVQHSISSWFGASGAPIFLANGHVVAINAGVTTVRQGGLTRELPLGVRIDCLWELIAYYNLANQLPIPVSEASLHLDRYRQVDDYEMRCHTAMALVNQCDRLMLMGDFQLALEKCNQALSLVPAYSKALRMRSKVRREYAGAQGANMLPEDKLRLLNKAFEDIRQYVKAVPDDPWGLIDACLTRTWIDWVRTGDSFNTEVQSQLTNLLETNVLDAQQRAYALSVRTAAIGYPTKCQADLDEALRLAPYGLTGAMVYHSRARFWRNHGQPDTAETELSRAGELLEAERLVAKAQETLEQPKATEEALRVALQEISQACEMTHYSRWQPAFLMAAAQHRLGNDTEATAWAARTLDLAPNSRKARIRLELAGYSRAVHGRTWTEGYWPDPPQTFEPAGGSESGRVIPASSQSLISDSSRPLSGINLSDEN